MQNKDDFNNDQIRFDDESLNANFIANAGIKDIVGRGLIYNDNVAIIELIKNAKDAQSAQAILEFNDIATKNNQIFSDAKIIIKDFGNGMTRIDLKEKWLNIAYSEKKNIKDKGYAGNKGVGRFSCDRLGSELSLYTKSRNDGYLRISINWEDFENKGKFDVISNIKLEIEVLDKQLFLESINESEFNHGTVLIVSNLRSSWSEQKLKKLIAEIEKFSPSLDNSFEVHFKSNVQFIDKELSEKTNKPINNNILEKLSFKTTYIQSYIDNTGLIIETFLYFQGELVYSYKAKNPYSLLKNISIEIHYLDPLSKSYFTKNFGIKPNNYGSIFLFYNSFRISPYGNEKNDWLGLDQRKSQGTSRNLGTREVIGRIDIQDNDDTFSVITSREGLAHNQAYYELVTFDREEKVLLANGKQEYGYVTTIIRQLENFVVKGTDWNRLEDKWGELLSISADDVLKNPDRFVTKTLSEANVINEVAKIKDSVFEIINFDVQKDLVSKIQSINEEKYLGFLYDFIENTEDKSLEDLSSKEKGIVKKLINTSKKLVNEANFRADQAQEERKIIGKSLEIEKKKQAYLLATRRTLSKDADGLIHTIKLNSTEIKEGIDFLTESIHFDELSKAEIIKKLSEINLYAVKNLKMSELATRSGFDQEIDAQNVDLVQFIKEYFEIYWSSFSNNETKCIFINSQIEFSRNISILNLSIVLDNLMSNSEKWGADKMEIEFLKENSELLMYISDNGYGLSDIFLEQPFEIFNLGVREQSPDGFSGSGIGLHYSKKLLNDMNADIEFLGNNINLSGACFKVVFK